VATPALHAIKQSLPDVELSLLASPAGAQVARLNRDIDQVIVHESPQIDPWCRLPLNSERELRLIAFLKERYFDAAIIFNSFRQTPLPAAYMCYLAGIPLRLAASTDGCGSLLTTRHKHPERLMHEVERGLDLVSAIGCRTDAAELVLEVPEQARAMIRDWHEGAGAPSLDMQRQTTADSPLIVVHPGCTMPARTYPWERYAEIVDLLAEYLGATVILTGSEDERPLVERIWKCVRPQNRAAAFPLDRTLQFAELCALIERADLVVTNNTGPMHIAAAVKTPVVALFALTNPPEQWGPWRVPHRLLYQDVACRFCHNRTCPYGHECLRSISPWMVLEAAGELLGGVTRAVGGTSVHEVLQPTELRERSHNQQSTSDARVKREAQEFNWRRVSWQYGDER